MQTNTGKIVGNAKAPKTIFNCHCCIKLSEKGQAVNYS